MSLGFSSEDYDSVDVDHNELESLLTSVVHYRKPKPDRELDRNNKTIQHKLKIRNFSKTVTNVTAKFSAEAAGR